MLLTPLSICLWTWVPTTSSATSPSFTPRVRHSSLPVAYLFHQLTVVVPSQLKSERGHTEPPACLAPVTI